MLLRHLALAIQDEKRSREFYERLRQREVPRPDGYVVEASWET